ncbi:MAG: sulfatase-like hydrolase/transferase [Planctomycetes bacterium]|nr:sulfatase-like hydrolase/transferase [Planctomycetota bacterium]
MNFVLICLDTFRADCVAALGRNDVIQTPNLDKFAREGVIFDNAFGEGQPTIEYRRALVTGMRTFPWRFDYDTRGLWPNGRGWHKICPEYDTLSEILIEKGYTTGFYSDTYHMFKPTQNFTRGFTSWEFVRGQESDNYRSGPLDAIDIDKYRRPGTPVNGILVQYLLNMQDRKTEDDWTSAQVFRKAIQFVEDNKASTPFFLWVDSFDPHEPWDPPTRFADQYDPDWDEPWEPIHGWGNADDKLKARARALYYGECTFVDLWVGRLLDKLDEVGVGDDTLVVITSDHGTELWDHDAVGKGAHRCRYRHNNEFLFLLRMPKKHYAGRRVQGFVQNHDILPTAMAVMSIDHIPVDGENLLPLITGEKESVRDHCITGWASHASVRTHEFNWSTDFEAKGPEEYLFKLDDDPGEMTNVAAEQPEICAEYRSKLEDYLGQELPAKLDDRIYPTEAPIRVWMKQAPCCGRFRKE